MSQPRLKKKSVLVVHPGDNLTPPGEHNYIRKLLAMREQGLFPASGAASVRISQHDWCDIFTGSACNCEPVIRVEQPKA